MEAVVCETNETFIVQKVNRVLFQKTGTGSNLNGGAKLILYCDASGIKQPSIALLHRSDGQTSSLSL